jgi:hypothetical protein
MKLNQPLVVKVAFATTADATRAIEQLEDMGIFGYIEHNPPRVVFTDVTSNFAKQAIRRLNSKPTNIYMLDPSEETSEGWAQFKQIKLD